MIKKVTPFLLSISVFSFIFSTSSSSNSWFKFYFSSLPLQLVSHTLDKSWIFLIANGILVVIANTSTNMTTHYSPSRSDLNDMLHSKIDDSLNSPPAVFQPHIKNDVSLEVEELEEAKENPSIPEEEEEKRCLILAEEEESHTQELQITDILPEEEDVLENSTEKKLMVIKEEDYVVEDESEDPEKYSIIEDEDYDEKQLYEEEDEEEEEGYSSMDKLSTEELNKKFEDFIRKMKEELRIEAKQQQLVLVK